MQPEKETWLFKFMINRRLLRIKVVQILFSYYKSIDKSLSAAKKELNFSIEKSYELYHYFLLLPYELIKYEQKIIDRNKTKKLPSELDLNPNTRFVDNKVGELLRENNGLIQFQNTNKISWVNNPELIKDLYTLVSSSQVYKDYMSAEASGFNEDRAFWVKIFKKILPEFEALGDLLEEMSIYWNDDSELVLSMAMKTIKNMKEEDGENYALMPLFKDDDDRLFAEKLMLKTILNNDEYQKLVEEATKHWDMERLAFMDNLIMKAAISEIMTFKNIPIKVSLNEYIEIAKNYSTQKSGVFINGVLDTIANQLQQEGKVNKIGRGLME